MFPLLNSRKTSQVSCKFESFTKQVSAMRRKREDHEDVRGVNPRLEEARFELPWELWLFIFIALDVRSLMAFARTCRRFYRLVLGLVSTGLKQFMLTHFCRKNFGSNSIAGYGQFNFWATRNTSIGNCTFSSDTRRNRWKEFLSKISRTLGWNVRLCDCIKMDSTDSVAGSVRTPCLSQRSKGGWDYCGKGQRIPL